MSTIEGYQDLIDEVKDELGDGILTKSEVIQVLRSDVKDENGYQQVLDWYYNHETMVIELEPDPSDAKEDLKEKLQIREQYQMDQPFLTNMTVEAFLAELIGKVNYL